VPNVHESLVAALSETPVKALAAVIVALGALFAWLYFKANGAAASDGGSSEDIASADDVNYGANDPFFAKIQQLANAIAFAEGFGKLGAVPTDFHNPGDLGPGDVGTAYPSVFKGGSNVSQLPDDATGWAALTGKLSAIFNGRSSVYSPTMTIEEMGQKYAGDSKSWSSNVAKYLGISPKTTLAEWWSM
jgi:hypothetical protein